MFFNDYRLQCLFMWWKMHMCFSTFCRKSPHPGSNQIVNDLILRLHPFARWPRHPFAEQRWGPVRFLVGFPCAWCMERVMDCLGKKPSLHGGFDALVSFTRTLRPFGFETERTFTWGRLTDNKRTWSTGVILLVTDTNILRGACIVVNIH